MPEHELHPLVHQAAARVRQKAVVAQKSALEGASNHVVQVDDPHEVAGLAVDDQKTPVGFGGGTLHITRKGLRRGRRRYPGTMKGTAAAHSREKESSITGHWRPDRNTRFQEFGA